MSIEALNPFALLPNELQSAIAFEVADPLLFSSICRRTRAISAHALQLFAQAYQQDPCLSEFVTQIQEETDPEDKLSDQQIVSGVVQGVLARALLYDPEKKTITHLRLQHRAMISAPFLRELAKWSDAHAKLSAFRYFCLKLPILSIKRVFARIKAQYPDEIERTAEMRRILNHPLMPSKLLQVTELDIGNAELMHIPDEIAYCARIACLKLNSNRLRLLPEALMFLKFLREIDLSRNRLTAIPSYFNQLAHLEKVNLYDNRFQKFPSALLSLPQLRYLCLAKNLLSALPPDISNMSALRELDLEKNKLSDLPMEFGKLSIKALDLSKNSFKQIPLALCQLSTLKRLYVSNNQIPRFPLECYQQLTALKTLDISNNQVEEISSEIVQMVSLKILFCSGNSLRSVPEEIAELPHLEIVDFSNNFILSLPPALLEKEAKGLLFLEWESLFPDIS